MSRPLRVGFVAEGPGDFVVLRAIASTKAAVVPRYIQPELDAIGGGAGRMGAGWSGVKKWSNEVAKVGGLDAAGALSNVDLLVIHVDGEVALEPDIACASRDGTPQEAAAALRQVVEGWMGGAHWRAVICVPAQDTDAWVFACLFPDAPECEDLENRSKPAKLLVQRKVLRSKDGEPKKSKASYVAVESDIAAGWAKAGAVLPEARRFDVDLDGVVSVLNLATSK